MNLDKRNSTPVKEPAIAIPKMSSRRSSKQRRRDVASLAVSSVPSSSSLSSSPYSSPDFHDRDENHLHRKQKEKEKEKNKWSDYVVTILHPSSSSSLSFSVSASSDSRPCSDSSSSSSSLSSSVSPSSSLFTFRHFPSFSLQFVLNICLVLVILLAISNLQTVDSCNEAVCASIVSKCTLTQSCKCTMKNCTCCKECFDCLSYLYSECCSCVELCPKPNITNQVIMHSQVGDLKEPMPDLFNILTEETDLQGRWTTFTFPIDIDQSWFQPKPETPTTVSTNAYTIADGKITIDPTRDPKDIVTVNCTVAYMSQCMPLNKCKNSCHSMGSSYFRWFHNGCCECVGTCINYGINESRCSECAADSDEDELEEPSEPSASTSLSSSPGSEPSEPEQKPEAPLSTDAPETAENTKETSAEGEPT